MDDDPPSWGGTPSASGRPVSGRRRGVRPRSATASRSARALPVALVALLVASGLAVSSSPTAPGRPGGAALEVPAARLVGATGSPPTNVTLTVNTTAVNLSSQFWGVTVSNEVHLLRQETDEVNATPTRVLVWPGAMAGEDYDPFTETHYNTYNGTPTPALTTEAQFVRMCEAIHCTAIVQVPAEIDDPSVAEAIVNYTEDNLSFHPAYWMIGNEPELWEHWKVPWKEWAEDDTPGPTPTQFGEEVVAYVNAIRAVDNSTPILGLPASGCTCGSWTFAQWIAGVLKVTGAKIQAVAFHEYPAGWLGTGDGSLTDFYQTIDSAASIPVRIVAARAAVQSACPGCNVSVFVSELGSALSWSSYGQYAAGYSGALSIASQITQAMAANVSNIDLFATELPTTNSWYGPNGYARPDYALYTSVFDHLGSEAFSAYAPGLSHTIYSIATIAPSDQGRQDLLVVNDNISHAITFTPRFPGSYSEAPTELWSWNGSIHHTAYNDTTWVEPYTPTPVPTELPDGLPSSYTLPPQSMVLFESYPTAAGYVRVNAEGVPNGTAWYASVGPEFYSTTAPSLSLMLPDGSYPVATTGIPLPFGGRELVPSEQLGGSVDSPLTVSGEYANATVNFSEQWRMNISAMPADGGTVTPEVGWWNASEPLELSASPLSGYAFVGWSGFGPGSYNGTNHTISITPTGRITERARFVPGVEVDVEEIGLPAGTPWSVTVRGFTTNATDSVLSVYAPNGTWGFSVSSVPGYRNLPKNGSFTVEGSWSLVTVEFVRITPPPPAFAVTFRCTGLPASTPVPITIRGATETSAIAPEFDLLNGSYGYTVGYVPGYHAAVAERTFNVTGGPLAIDLPFVPTDYAVTWEAFGTRAGMNWSVDLGGPPVPASSAWISTSLPNGTYPYTIDLPANYSASPRTGVLVVHGGAARLDFVFQLVEFPAGFAAAGLGTAQVWSVRLGDLTLGESSNRSSFFEANGTYTFDVHPPPGYYAVPSHGTLTVAGNAAPVAIHFYPVSTRPSAALVASLSAGALTVAIWIGLSGFVGFVAVRGIRRARRGPR